MDIYRQQGGGLGPDLIDDLGTSPPGGSFLTYKDNINNNNINNSGGSGTLHKVNSSGGGGTKTSVAGWYESQLFEAGFGSFLKSAEFSDITIVAAGKQYCLHRVILAHSSKFLSDYFDSNTIDLPIDDNNNNQTTRNITTIMKRIDKSLYELKGSFVEYFDRVVGYMYDGHTELTENNSLPILSLSNTLHIKALKRECTFYLTRSINKDNAFHMLHKAIHINSEDLITKCITVICKHFNQIIQPHFSSIFQHNNNLTNNLTNNSNNLTNNNNLNNNNFNEDNIPIITKKLINNIGDSSGDGDEGGDDQQTTTIVQGSDSDLDDDSVPSSESISSTTISSTGSSSLQIPTSPLSINNNNSNNNNNNNQSTIIPKIIGSPSPTSSYLASNNNDKSLNPSTIHTVPELLSLSVPIMVRLMRQNNLSVSNEAIVYKTIVKYIQANRTSLSEGDIASLFEVVRFPLFNYQQLEEAQDNTLIPKHLITEALLLRLKIHEGPKQGGNSAADSLAMASTSPSSSSQFGVSFKSTSSSSSSSILSSSHLAAADGNSSLMSIASDHQQQQPSTSLESRKTPRAAYAISLEYQHDFDTCGVFYYIGTNGYKEDWSNPAMRGRVRVTSSSIEKGSVTECVGRTPSECWSMDVPASWIAINLGSSRTMVPTYYTLRHGGNSKADCLRNWTLQGSMDSKSWTVLSRHSNDGSLNGNFSSFTWPILNCTQAYRHFRLLQTGRNSSNHNFLSISGIEFYGDMYETKREEHII